MVAVDGVESFLEVTTKRERDKRVRYTVQGWTRWLTKNSICDGDECIFGCFKDGNCLVMVMKKRFLYG